MGNAVAGQPSLQVPPIAADPNVPSATPGEDPMSAFLASLGDGPRNSKLDVTPLRPRTLTQKLLPVLHVLSMLAMLAWFVVWKEPEAFEASWLSGGSTLQGSEKGFVGYNLKEFGWRRWARLARGPSTIAGLAVPSVVRHMLASLPLAKIYYKPAFFWAFTTLELALHSLRLFTQPVRICIVSIAFAADMTTGRVPAPNANRTSPALPPAAVSTNHPDNT